MSTKARRWSAPMIRFVDSPRPVFVMRRVLLLLLITILLMFLILLLPVRRLTPRAPESSLHKVICLEVLGISAPLQVLRWLANIGVVTVFFWQQASGLPSSPPGVNFTIKAIEDDYYGRYRSHCASGPGQPRHHSRLSRWLMKPNTGWGVQYVPQSTSCMALQVFSWRAKEVSEVDVN